MFSSLDAKLARMDDWVEQITNLVKMTTEDFNLRLQLLEVQSEAHEDFNLHLQLLEAQSEAHEDFNLRLQLLEAQSAAHEERWKHYETIINLKHEGMQHLHEGMQSQKDMIDSIRTLAKLNSEQIMAFMMILSHLLPALVAGLDPKGRTDQETIAKGVSNLVNGARNLFRTKVALDSNDNLIEGVEDILFQLEQIASSVSITINKPD